MPHSNNLGNDARHHPSLIQALARLISAATLMLCLAAAASAQVIYPTWTDTGKLNVARRGFTATLLANGKVLVAGGFNNTDNACARGRCLTLNTAELYDSATGVWTSTGNLNVVREFHTATLLPSGKVLVVGGYPLSKSAELYDPATGTWSNTGNLNTGRAFHTATLLPNGKVLVARGGLNSAELYDPATGAWSHTGNLNKAGFGTAMLLPSGKVLVVGGDDVVSGAGDSAELYDSITGTWSMTGRLNEGRFATATLLPNGKVLATGSGKTAELYDPATGTWTFTGNLNYERSAHTATLLQNGKILIVGGVGGPVLSSAEMYDPFTGEWSVTAYLNTPHVQHTATLLPDGRVLVAGGYKDQNTIEDLNTAELYDPNSSPNINMIDDARFLAHQHYADFLNREPDADGLAFWTNQITSCGADAQCIEVKRINVSASFFLSIEFQEIGYFVYRIHKAAHGNLSGKPVPVNLDEFLSESQEVGSGVVVRQPGWEQVLESNKQSYLAVYGDGVDDRFTLAYPTSMTPAAFVDALFQNSEVTPSASDRAAAISEFGSAITTEDILARSRALRRVADNSTLREQEFNRAFVLMQYFGYLRRNPNDAPDGNFDGYNFWLTKLNQFNGNYIEAEMVKAFLSSIEYRHHFGT